MEAGWDAAASHAARPVERNVVFASGVLTRRLLFF